MAELEMISEADLTAASEMMIRSWKRPCWLYTPEVLKDYLHRPRADPDLIIRVRRDGRLVGFFAGVPIDVRYRGNAQRCIFTTMLTVEQGNKDLTLPLMLYQRLIEAARAKAYTHIYTVFFRAAGPTKGVQTMFRLAGAPMNILSEIDFLLGTRGLVSPHLAAADSASIRPYDPKYRTGCASLFERQAAELPLSETFAVGDMDWLLGGLPTTMTRLWVEGDTVQGLITSRRRDLPGDQVKPNAQIDYLLIDGLAHPQRDALLHGTLRDLYALGVDWVTVPVQGHLSADQLTNLGFLPTPNGAWAGVAYLADDAERVEAGLPSFFEVF